jgi:hypothetical protein
MEQTLRRMVRFSVPGVDALGLAHPDQTLPIRTRRNAASKFGAAETSRFAGRETTQRNPQPPEHEFF